jgi:alpha-tubulin suppressor-like RCC1 family protein
LPGFELELLLEGALKAIRSVRGCFWLLFGMLAVLSACGSDTPPPGDLAKKCSIPTDCASPLVCVFGLCHEQCVTSRDCPVPLRCVVGTDVVTGQPLSKPVCQLPEEAKKCAANSDCPDIEICGLDGRCRDQCAEAKDCPVRGQLCINKTCADPEELNDRGTLDIVNDGGTTRDGAPITPEDDGSTGAGGGGTGGSTSAGGGMPDGGNDVSVGGSGGMDASRDVSQPPYDGPCGHSGQPCCLTGQACTLGYVCNAGMMCVTCGSKGQACCSNNNCLDSNLDCVNNTCTCGDSNQVCCSGTTCSAGLTCSPPTDAGQRSNCACGGNLQVCCPNMMCNGASLKCAGTKCTCITACAADHASGYGPNILRTDGSVWFYTAYSQPPVPVKDIGMATVTGFTKVVTAYQFSCGIKSDKTAWCWANANNTSTSMNTGELGDGTQDWSKSPVQVVKSLNAGDYLTDVVDISSQGSTTCAVTDGGTPGDGSDDYVYCWGANPYGQLGNASNNAPSKWAVRVVTAAGAGAPALTNINQVSVGQYHTCAHQRSTSGGEGNVWCWGYNSNGSLGNDSNMQSEFAVQTAIFNATDGASEVAIGNQMSCARTGPDVWCWGYSNVGDGTTGAHLRPVRVLTGADSGTPFTGVAAIRGGNSGVCALMSADKSVWCWGQTAFPTQSNSASSFPVSSVNFWDIDSSSNVCFGAIDGILYFQNQKITSMNLVPCP